MRQNAQRGREVARKVDNAYMTDLYRDEWEKVGAFLANQGLDNRQIEAVLRSKYMRWSSDQAGGKCTLKDFKVFWSNCKSLTRKEEIEKLTEETFANFVGDNQ